MTTTITLRRRTTLLKFIFLALGLAAGLALLLMTPPEGLSREGARCLGVAVICFSLWVLQSIPLAATSLLVIALLPTFNILGRNQVFSFFGNSAVFFLLGVFILSGAIIRTGLSKRLAFIFISRFGRSPNGLVMGVTFSCAIFSLLMPCHAVAAMMLPVILEIASSLRLERGRSTLGKALFLAMAWGAGVGSIGTYLGGARVPLAVEFLHESYGRSISFMTWAAAAVPIAVVLTLLLYMMLIKFLPSELKEVSAAKEFLGAELHRIGRMSAAELKIAAITLIAIAAWIFGGNSLGLAVVSIVAAVAVFVFRIAKWPEISDYVNWGVIVMYGGAIALGKALYETKAIEWVVKEVLGSADISPFLLICILSILSMVMTEAISNAAAVVILIPVAYGFVSQTGLSPEILTLAVTVPTGLAFVLPVGTPPNAIAFSSGYFSIRDAMALGLPFKVVAWIVFILAVRFLWPLLGLAI